MDVIPLIKQLCESFLPAIPYDVREEKTKRVLLRKMFLKSFSILLDQSPSYIPQENDLDVEREVLVLQYHDERYKQLDDLLNIFSGTRFMNVPKRLSVKKFTSHQEFMRLLLSLKCDEKKKSCVTSLIDSVNSVEDPLRTLFFTDSMLALTKPKEVDDRYNEPVVDWTEVCKLPQPRDESDRFLPQPPSIEYSPENQTLSFATFPSHRPEISHFQAVYEKIYNQNIECNFEKTIMNEVFNVLQGIPTQIFGWENSHFKFVPRYVRLHDSTVKSLFGLLSKFAEIGTKVYLLDLLISSQKTNLESESPVIQNFFTILANQLAVYKYRICLLREAHGESTLLLLLSVIEKIFREMQFFYELCQIESVVVIVQPLESPQKDSGREKQAMRDEEEDESVFSNIRLFKSDSNLLSGLYEVIKFQDFSKDVGSRGVSLETRLMYNLFCQLLNTFCLSIQRWIYFGESSSVVKHDSSKFIESSRKEGLKNWLDTKRDFSLQYFTQTFVVPRKSVPSFLREVIPNILSTGRQIDILRISYPHANELLESSIQLGNGETLNGDRGVPRLVMSPHLGDVRYEKMRVLSHAVRTVELHESMIRKNIEEEIQKESATKSLRRKRRIEQNLRLEGVIQETRQAKARLQQQLKSERLEEIALRREARLRREVLERERELREEKEEKELKERLISEERSRMLREYGNKMEELRKRHAILDWRKSRLDVRTGGGDGKGGTESTEEQNKEKMVDESEESSEVEEEDLEPLFEEEEEPEDEEEGEYEEEEGEEGEEVPNQVEEEEEEVGVEGMSDESGPADELERINKAGKVKKKRKGKASKQGKGKDEEEECGDEGILLPLQHLLSETVLHHIKVRSKTVDTIVRSILLHELHLEDHFTFLRKFFFLQYPPFVDRLSDALFDIPRNDQADLMDSNEDRIFKVSSLMSDIIEQSILIHRDSAAMIDKEKEKFERFVTKYIKVCSTEMEETESSQKELYFEGFKDVAFDYICDFPLNLIFSASSIHKYRRIFKFLLRQEFVRHRLDRVFLIITKDWKGRFDPFLREVQVLRYRILSMVQTFRNYFEYGVIEHMSQILNQRIMKIRQEESDDRKFATHDCLLYFRGIHEEYLAGVEKGCFLGSTESEKVISNCLTRIWIVGFKLYLFVRNFKMNRTDEENVSGEAMAMRIVELKEEFEKNKEILRKEVMKSKSSLCNSFWLYSIREN